MRYFTVRVDSGQGNKVTQFVEAKQEKPGGWKTNGLGHADLIAIEDQSVLHTSANFVTNGSYIWFEVPDSKVDILQAEFDKGNMAAQLRS